MDKDFLLSFSIKKISGSLLLATKEEKKKAKW
jgi:hypothetical protein